MEGISVLSRASWLAALLAVITGRMTWMAGILAFTPLSRSCAAFSNSWRGGGLVVIQIRSSLVGTHQTGMVAVATSTHHEPGELHGSCLDGFGSVSHIGANVLQILLQLVQSLW